jgi:hypothetical protein
MSIDPFKHSATAEANRKAKATTLARFLWDRDISGPQVLAFSDKWRRKLARAAAVNPPSSITTWEVAAELLAAKQQWLDRGNHEHAAAARNHLEDQGTWIPEPAAPTPV